MYKLALFLDRDGVINEDFGYVHTKERAQFVTGIFDLVKFANVNGYLVIVATNQAGIGRGYYSENQFFDFMSWMKREFRERGATIDDVFYSPYHPTEGLGEYKKDTNCRKPKPGMFLCAARKHNIDLKNSIIIGDRETDMLAGKRAGIGFLLMLSEERSLIGKNIASLYEAKQYFKKI